MAKESIISKVQKLLNLAMDPAATEDERLLAQKRADELMVRHMIEQSDLKADDPRRTRVGNSVWKINLEHEFSNSLRDLLGAIVRHAQCRCVTRLSYDPETKTNTKVTVVGTPEGIAYAERLWFIVFSELSRNMFPKVDPTQSFDANVYAFVKAGFKWREIHEIMWRHKDDPRWMDFNLPDPYPADKQPAFGFERVYGGDGGRLKRAYNREAKRLGEEARNHTSRHGAYRASYVQSFASTISRRLFEIRKSSEKAVDDQDRYALAVQDVESQVNAEFYLLFPHLDPENIRKREEEILRKHKERLEAMTPEQRAAYEERERRERARASRIYDRIRDKSFDSAGWARGNQVAERVNLNDHKAAGHKKQELA